MIGYIFFIPYVEERYRAICHGINMTLVRVFMYIQSAES